MTGMDITQIDRNFAPMGKLPDNAKMYNAMDDPLIIEGLYRPRDTGIYGRLPQELVPRCNEGVQFLAGDTSGGRVRFATDSAYIIVAVELARVHHRLHMARSGTSGVDVYAGPRGCKEGDKRFCAVFYTADPLDDGIRYASVHRWKDNTPREITLNLPLYNGVKSLYIGLEDGANVWAPVPYAHTKPVLFYGSSITQGGCACHPGNSYTNHLSRWLDMNFICLGFAGSAKGEEHMARHIASLDIAALVLDYDHNSPDSEYLEKTHEPFFKTIRKARPDLPVVMVSRPDFDRDEFGGERRDIVMKTYGNAIRNGDPKVWFVDGEVLFGTEDQDACTVDGCHPNDLGFYRMAQTILPKLTDALKVI